MPIYEFYCRACKKTSSFLLLRASEEIEPYCKHCRSRDVKRILSRVSVPKSEEKRMGGELGEDLGEGFEEEMEEAMAREDSSSEGDL